jgi:acyl carrier protein
VTSNRQHVEMVISEVREVLTLNREEPVDEASVLRELPGADSVNLLRVAARLERRTGIEFDDEKLYAAATVSDLAELLGSTE